MSESEVQRRLCGRRWVQVPGDEAGGAAVYRDAAGDVPLSRGPREFLQFDADGTVRRLVAGPDDRSREVGRGRWEERERRIHFAFDDAGPAMSARIDRASAGERLVVDRD